MKIVLTLLVGLFVLSYSVKKEYPSLVNILLSEKLNIQVDARVQYYKKNIVKDIKSFEFNKDFASIQDSETSWNCTRKETIADDGIIELIHTFKLNKGESKATGVSVSFLLEEWGTENYVIMPGAAYNGNRYEVKKYRYPPLFRKSDYDVNMPITISDVPRLSKGKGKSRMDLNTGDFTTPAIGIYFPKTNRGIWITTEQATELGNSVISLKENSSRTKAELIIAAPCVREEKYTMAKLSPSDETGLDWNQGDIATIRCKIHVLEDIHSPAELNKAFLTVRNDFSPKSRVDNLPFSKAFMIMEKQQNNERWDEKNGFYTLGGESWNMKWQLGWVGGCMVTQPLGISGKPLSKERSFVNYNTIITQTQANSGFYYSCGNGEDFCSDCFSNPFPDNLLLLRKNADALYYFYKYVVTRSATEPGWKMPKEWEKPLNKFSDAFVKLWNDYGQFGQFIDMETGEIKVGGTNSAILAVGGLALASKFENRPELLQIAKEAARYYHKEFIVKGISCGGPGEILQNNDSESAFATLEAFVTLYEVTGEKEWLNYAEDAAALCATWVVSYDYKYPSSSLFGKNNLLSTGAVWASVQNKHAAPGICTLSGDSMFKLYRFTGNEYYLNIIGDIAHNIVQYISREDVPISKHEGWVTERVNLSDWEGTEYIGDLNFDYSSWAQVATLLSVTEIPGIYYNLKNKTLYVFDHVNATIEGDNLVITNPTKYNAAVKVFIDKNSTEPYFPGFISQCPVIKVNAGESVTYKF